ncbi:hypothetical protein ABK040_002625 [Willaertia magna]
MSEQQQQREDDSNMSENDKSKKDNIKDIVFTYLKQKGYITALKYIQEEEEKQFSTTTSDINEFTANSERENILNTTDSTEVITNYINESSSSSNTGSSATKGGKTYLQAYQSLTDWVYSSLEIYKNELIQVLYPVFVHCYLELVQKGFIDEARKFLTKYKTQHANYHYDEILTLQSLQSNEIIQQNEFSQRLLSHKFIIRLSEASFHLLMKFLQDASELRLLSILNQFVNFKTYKGQPSLQAPAMIDGVLLLDHDIKQGTQQKHKRKRKGGADDEGDHTEDDENEEEEDEDEFDAIFGRNKKVNWEVEVNREDISNLMSAAGAGSSTMSGGMLGGVGGATTTAQIPPQQPGRRGRKKKGAGNEAQKEMKRLIDVAKEQVPPCPSVCYYTFFNSKSNLNTIEIGTNFENRSSNYFINDGDFAPQYNIRNGPVVAAGFSDSTIKCWNWRLTNGTIPNTKSFKSYSEEDNETNENRECEYDTLVGHSGPVYSLSFNSDQQWLLSGSEDCTVRLWNVNNSENVVIYKGHQYAIWNVTFSPMDYMFATASHDRTARLWVTDRVTPVRILAGHLSDVECVKFHPNCNYVATGSSDKTVRLWDVQTGECMRLFIGHHAGINCLAFSHDGRYCASAGEDNQILVWDIGSGKIAYKFIGHTNSIWSLDFNRNDTFLASGSLDGTVRIWSMFDTIDTGSVEGSQSAAQILKEKKLELNKHKMITKEPYKTYYTKQTPVYTLKFTQQDFIVASGMFC